MDLGVDRGHGCRAGPRRSHCSFVSPETKVGDAHVPGCLRRTLGEFSHAGASGGARPRRSSRGYDSRASGFLSGTFKGSQQRWATVDKKGFAMVSTFMRLEYLLWNGVHIYTDHRNLAYISTRSLSCRPFRRRRRSFFGPVEGGIGAVRLYYHAHRRRPKLPGGFALAVGECSVGNGSCNPWCMPQGSPMKLFRLSRRSGTHSKRRVPIWARSLRGLRHL